MAVRSTQETVLISSRGASRVRSSQEVLLISSSFVAMGINYPLTPPAISGIGPQDFTLAQVNVVGESVSPFTLGQQEQQWPGQMFTIEATLPPMLLAQAEQWISFLGALFGKTGTFLMGDYNRPTPQGPWSGNPVISGVNSNGSNTLNLRGAAAAIASWAVAGDYLQVTASGGSIKRLYKVLQNASTDGSGNVSLSIFPNIRETLSDGIAIVTANPVGTFRLQENTITPKTNRNRVYSISFKAKEAI